MTEMLILKWKINDETKYETAVWLFVHRSRTLPQIYQFFLIP